MDAQLLRFAFLCTDLTTGDIWNPGDLVQKTWFGGSYPLWRHGIQPWANDDDLSDQVVNYDADLVGIKIPILATA